MAEGMSADTGMIGVGRQTSGREGTCAVPNGRSYARGVRGMIK
jgi:hypothetical protein